MRTRRSPRFTLVELMIVIAIVALLAALAIPVLANMQLRSRRSELLLNLKGIADAVASYAPAVGADDLVSFGTTVTYWPRDLDSLDKAVAPWPAAATDFNTIGWAPSGDVRCSYQFQYHAVHANSAGAHFARGDGACDVDDDAMLFYGTVYDNLGTDPPPPSGPMCSHAHDGVGKCSWGPGCDCF